MSRSSFALAVLAVLALSPWLAKGVSCAPAETRDEILELSAEPEPPVIAGADWEGLRRDTWYFVGYQAVTVAVLHAMPAEETNFDRSGASFDKWRDNVTNPVPVAFVTVRFPVTATALLGTPSRPATSNDRLVFTASGAPLRVSSIRTGSPGRALYVAPVSSFRK